MRILFFNILLAFCLISKADPIEFKTFKLNKAKIFTPKGEKASHYKKPSTKSPVLHYGSVECEVWEFRWSNKLKDVDLPEYILETNEPVLAIDYNNQFYKVIAGNEDCSTVAYIAKDEVKETVYDHITMEDVKEDFYTYNTFSDKGFERFIIGYNENEPEERYEILLGTIHDGLIVFSHATTATFRYDKNATSIRYEYDTDTEGLLKIYFGTDLIKTDIKTLDVLNLDKLTREQKMELLNTLGVNKEPNTCIIRAKHTNSAQIGSVYLGNGEGNEFVTKQTITVDY